MTQSDHTATPVPKSPTDSTRSRSTRPGRHRQPYPSAPARTVPTRHGALRASAPTRHHTVWTGPIPATVWACGPIDPDATWPTAILTKIVSSFSAPGDRIVLLPCPARTGGLTDYSPAVESDAEVATALAAIKDLHRTPQVIHVEPIVTASAPTSPPSGADHLSALDSPYSPRAHPLPASTSNPAAIRPDTTTGEADLIITSLHPQHSACANDHMAVLTARLLRVGGILAVLTHSDWSSGELLDPTGPLVACAQNADLLYLQHIIALHTRIRHATTVSQTPGAQRRGLATPHHRISSDVLVFAQPHDHQPPRTFATQAKTEVLQ